MEKIRPNIYQETKYRGGNKSFVVTRQGTVMIDTPMRPSDAIEWQQEMIKKGEIKYLINTDQHPDHFLTNKFFPGKIIAHNATRETIINWPKEKVIEFVNRADPEAS